MTPHPQADLLRAIAHRADAAATAAELADLM